MSGFPFATWYHRLAAALLTLLLAVNAYRASTQSLTVDEALTYNHFIHQQDARMATVAPFNDNLGTWLSRLSVAAFGPSEFAMRLPSLLAGAVYFYALLRICSLLFASPLIFLLAIAVNSLNPFLLDQLSAARGYGLAVAFLLSAITVIAEWIYRKKRGDWRWPALAGTLLGLSVLSHLSAIFPVLAVAVATVVISKRRIAALPMVAAFALLASLALVPALREVRTSAVDGVAAKFIDGWKSLIECCLFYKPGVLSAWKPLHRLGWLAIPLFMLALLAAVPRLLRRRPHESLLLLFALSLPLMWLLLFLEPRFYHHGYFASRRLLAGMPLMFLALPALLHWLKDGNHPARALSACGCAILGGLSVAFLLQANVSSYYGWEQDAASRPAMEILRQKRPVDVNGTASLGADEYLYESLNYYRDTLMLEWLKPVTQASPECTYDFYYVRAANLARIERFGLKELMRDAVAGTVLAEPSAEAIARRTALRELGIDRPAECTGDVMARFGTVGNQDPQAERAMLRGFMPAQPGRWRWTFEHPALLLHAPKRAGLRFTLEFVLHSATFKDTGPVRLSVTINGQPLGEKVYTAPEGQTFSAPVAESTLRPDGIALMETQLDKYYSAPDDHQKLGYLFVRAGISDAASK